MNIGKSVEQERRRNEFRRKDALWDETEKRMVLQDEEEASEEADIGMPEEMETDYQEDCEMPTEMEENVDNIIEEMICDSEDDVFYESE